MVTVVDVKQRQSNNGETFNALIIEGDIQIVTSKETGEPYATARRTSIPSTFDGSTAEKLIGKELPGKIERVPSEPYEYQIPGEDKTVILEHSFEYNPEPSNVEEEVFEPQKSSNGREIESLA